MIIIEKFLKFTILNLIKLYNLIISPHLGTNCRYLPTCSEYAKDAILTKGIIKGSILSVKRVLRCHPWSKSGYDPIEKQKEENIL